MEKLPVRLRPANEEDIPFIFNAWLKSYRNSEPVKRLQNEVYFSEHHKVIERILKFYNVIIACSDEDPTQIFGFICAGYTDNIFTLHYLYVKHTFRKMGIGSMLVNSFDHEPETAALCSHVTPSTAKFLKKYNFVHHPYLAYDPAAYNKKDNPAYGTYNEKESPKK